MRAYRIYLGIKGFSALFTAMWVTVASVYRQALTAALILSPTLLLYARAMRRGGTEPELKDATPEK